MRIVAWNIRAGGGVRATAIAEQRLRWRADVVALSEFRGTPPSLRIAEALSDAGLAHQLHSINPRVPAENRLLLASRWRIETLALAGAPSRSGKWIAARVHAPQPFATIAVPVPNRVTGKKWPIHAGTLRAISRTYLGIRRQHSPARCIERSRRADRRFRSRRMMHADPRRGEAGA